LDGKVISRDLEGLKHDFSHFFSVSFWVSRGFCEEGRVLVGSNSKFVVEAVVPYLLHVIPVVNDAVFNGIS